MSDELRVVMVTTNILDDIEEGLDLSAEPTVILQGSVEAVKAAAKLFGEPVTIAALPAADLADALAAALRSAQQSIADMMGVHGYPLDSGAGEVLREVSAALAAWEGRK